MADMDQKQTNEAIAQELKRIRERLDVMEKFLVPTLLCSILPADGPNWNFNQALFGMAEQRLKDGKDIFILVREALEALDTDIGEN